jgi:hypothetical protein
MKKKEPSYKKKVTLTQPKQKKMDGRAIPTTRSYSNYPSHEGAFYENPGQSYASAMSYSALQQGRTADACTSVPGTKPVPQFKAPVSCKNGDPWRDQQDDRECNQLNLQSLMPSNWQPPKPQNLQPQTWESAGQSVLAPNGEEGCDESNWARYSVTPEAYAKYVAAQGAYRVNIIGRSSIQRRVGMSNMLRSEVMPALTLSPDAVVFNDSPDRAALVNPQLRNFYGCGQ